MDVKLHVYFVTGCPGGEEASRAGSAVARVPQRVRRGGSGGLGQLHRVSAAGAERPVRQPQPQAVLLHGKPLPVRSGPICSVPFSSVSLPSGSILFRPVLFCSVPARFVPFCSGPVRPVLFRSILFRSVRSVSLLFCSVPFCSVVFRSVLFHFALFRSVLFCSVPFCSVLFCFVPFCSVVWPLCLFQAVKKKANFRGQHRTCENFRGKHFFQSHKKTQLKYSKRNELVV